MHICETLNECYVDINNKSYGSQREKDVSFKTASGKISW